MNRIIRILSVAMLIANAVLMIVAFYVGDTNRLVFSACITIVCAVLFAYAYIDHRLEEIVRCRDCRYYTHNTFPRCDLYSVSHEVEPNGFCAWAERNEVDA